MRTMQLDLDRITEADLSSRYCLNFSVKPPALTGSGFPSEVSEHRVYQQLLALSPGLEERLCTGSDQDIFYVAEMVCGFFVNVTCWKILILTIDRLTRGRLVHGQMTPNP